VSWWINISREAWRAALAAHEFPPMKAPLFTVERQTVANKERERRARAVARLRHLREVGFEVVPGEDVED